MAIVRQSALVGLSSITFIASTVILTISHHSSPRVGCLPLAMADLRFMDILPQGSVKFSGQMSRSTVPVILVVDRVVLDVEDDCEGEGLDDSNVDISLMVPAVSLFAGPGSKIVAQLRNLT